MLRLWEAGLIRALLRLAEWLDKRFPPKVVVTQSMYDSMVEKQHRHGKDILMLGQESNVLRDRCFTSEKSLAALKDGIVKGQVPLSSTEKAAMRDSFIRGEFGRETSTIATEAVKS